MSEYIRSLRQHLGHTPLLQVGASVIVINEVGQMLMQQRTDCGSWGYAGGSVELGESVEQTAERELFEETGLKAKKLELLGVYSGEKMQYTYPNGDKVSNVDIVYTCHEYTGE
ncbi:NUDIX hydrolase, partial [Ruminococcus sp. CAG:57]